MTKPGMFGLTFAHLSLRPNFPLSGSLSFPLSGKFGLRPDRKNDFTFWINFRSAESLVSAKDERKSEPKVKVTHYYIVLYVLFDTERECMCIRKSHSIVYHSIVSSVFLFVCARHWACSVCARFTHLLTTFILA